MSLRHKIAKIAMIGYAVVAIITFGYGASNLSGNCGPHPCSTFDQAVGGVFAAVLWPLYWSWEAWA